MKKNLLALLLLLSGGVRLAAAPVAITLTAEPQQSVLPAGTGTETMIKIAIAAPAPAAAAVKQAPRVNLAVALDRSGSMQGQRKIENAREAAKKALELLGEDDYFSLIAYDDVAEVVVPSTRVTATGRARIRRIIDGIGPRGSTALFAGVSLAAAELRRMPDEPGRVNRLILLSDGQANVGPSTPGELGRLGASLVKEGFSVSTIGVGAGYNEDLMTELAQNSDGNFYFVENGGDLPMIFEKELGSALLVAAQRVRVRIVCPAGVRPRGILGHRARFDGQVLEMDFNNLYAGHEKVFILQLELPAGVDGGRAVVAEVRLDYETAEAKAAAPLTGAVAVSFSGSRDAVARSLNKSVLAEVANQQSTVMREEAIREADAGNYPAAREKLAETVEYLRRSAAVTGDESVRCNQLRAEEEARQMKQAEKPEEYNHTRKLIRGRSFQYRNNQVYQQ